jgi:hypothetical protein
VNSFLCLKHSLAVAALLGVAPLLNGCAPERQASLAEFEADALKISVDRDHITVVVTTLEREVCPMLSPDVRATLNGAAMTATSLGGAAGQGERYACQAAAFSIPVAALPSHPLDAGEIVIADGSTTLSVRVPDLCDRRVLEPVSPIGRYRRGTPIELRWPVASDRLGRVAAFLEAEVPGDDTRIALEARVTSGRVILGGKKEAPPGRYELVVDVPFEAPVDACEGARVCEAGGIETFRTPVMVAR